MENTKYDYRVCRSPTPESTNTFSTETAVVATAAICSFLGAKSVSSKCEKSEC